MGENKQPLAQKKIDAGANFFNIGSTQTEFLKVIDAVMEQLKKRLFKPMDLAKHSRVFDPTPFGSLSHDIAMYHQVMRADLCSSIKQSGEWKLYFDSLRPSTQQFILLGWCEGMREHLPLWYKCARRTLAIPHSSCDVERSVGMCKRMRSKEQHIMQHGTLEAYVSFCFNGVALAP